MSKLTQEEKNHYAEQVAEFIRNSDEIEWTITNDVVEIAPDGVWMNFEKGNTTMNLKIVKKVRITKD